jgi:hypothetical protein
MKKNQPLPYVMVTPTTKEEAHDRPITPEEIVSTGLMTAGDWEYVSGKALALFKFGQAQAASRGLILVDTKYEFGRDVRTGEILLIDEIHTPDSSRYWLSASYPDRLAAGKEPDNIDKEFLRIWFRNNCDPYADGPLPDAPEELVAELSKRYIQLYETITGERFEAPAEGGGAGGIAADLAAAVARFFPPAPVVAKVFALPGEDGPGPAAAAAFDAAANGPYAAATPVASRVAVELVAIDVAGAPRAAVDACKAAGAAAAAGGPPHVAVVVCSGACGASAEFVRRQSGLPTVAVSPGCCPGADGAVTAKSVEAAAEFVAALAKQATRV